MKTCPICNRSYADNLETCDFDGSMLRGQERAADPLIGTTLRQRYKIIEKISRGAISDTYVAQQVQIGRRVLLKVLNQEYAQDEAFVRRFRQEAKLLSSLNHPCLIQLFDFDQADDGRLFIVTEFLQGKSLKSILQNQVLDTATIVRLAT
jgi:serine/threonine-protein kinase